MTDKHNLVFLTGAAGFVGFHLASLLLRHGLYVVGVDNLNDYYDVGLKKARLNRLQDDRHFQFLKADLADAKTVFDLFKNFHPSVVVHLAAQAGVRYSIENPNAYINSNITGFFNILEGCRHYPVNHLLYASSSSVYGNQKKTPFSVTDNVDRPISLYAATKKSNELMSYTYSHLYGIPTTGLRFFTVYGPFGRPDMAYFKFTKKILAEEPIQVFNNGDMLRDFTYVDDLVTCIEAMLDVPPRPDTFGVRNKVYNIGNNTPVRLGDFIATLEKLLGRTATKEYLPMQAGDVYQTFADVDDLIRDFHFSPSTPIETGLARFVEWYRTFYG